MIKQTLNGTWKLEGNNIKEAIDLKVPGSVLSALIEKKMIRHPYERDYEYAARDLFKEDYTIGYSFEVTERLLEKPYIDLVCYGIDTLAEIYLNDRFLFYANNMHRTWRVNCKEFLRQGTNHIRIVLKSTLKYIEQYQPEEGKEISYIACGAMKGNQYIRKAHSMFGWDWGAQLPDAGIWRDIQLEAYDKARLEDVLIRQEHKENAHVSLDITSSLICYLKGVYHIKYGLTDPEGRKAAGTLEILDASEKGNASQHIVLEVPEPRLWWPNGYGSQPLYHLEVTLLKDEEVLESRNFTIGLRTLTISQEKDKWGIEFAFKVNGLKIFTRGANYIPEDCIYSWITKDRIDYLLKSAAECHFNCIRVWGGGYYPSDEFYELCDQYGLIVWQDLMYACNIYDVTDEFAENIVAEAEDNVKRLRHHPSLGLWCGNNEIESAWTHWEGFCDHPKKLKADYIKQFEYLLPKAVKKLSPDTFYWPSSPSSGGCFDEPDSPDRGDNHYWDVWHGQKPFSDYQKYFFRFCSEFGFQSFPSIKTIRTFTEEEDRNIFSKVMESHQKNDAANGKMLYYLSETFKYPKDFESLIYLTQILQGMAIKSGVEHWRRNRGRCMGTLFWQLNDNWPVASWSSIDYYGRWKALQYMAKKFYAPCAGSVVRHEKTISAYIQNETQEEKSFKVTLNLKKLDFTVIDTKTFTCQVPKFSVYKVCDVDYSTQIKGIEEEVFAEVIFENGKEVSYESEIFVPYKYLQLPDPQIRYEIEEDEKSYRFKIKAKSFAPFIELDLPQADAVLEDNYFTLTSDREKIITLEKEKIKYSGVDKTLKVLNIHTIKDTF